MARIKGWVVALAVLAVSLGVITLAGAADLKLLSQDLPKASYTASSFVNYQPTTPDKAFDGKLQGGDDKFSFWCAGPNYPQWLQVDLGDTYNIVKTMTYWERSTVWYGYKIEVSADKQTWTMFADKTKNQDPAGDPAYTDMGSATGRYVRITNTDVQDRDKSWYWPVIWEFQVYGTPVKK
jgi:hypothetical protein